MDLSTRHPATQEIMQYFAYEHLPPHLQVISAACHDLAMEMVDALPDGPELTTGLRKLLEAKDCFVRHMVGTRNSMKAVAEDAMTANQVVDQEAPGDQAPGGGHA